MPARAVVRTALTGVLAGLLTVVCSCAADPTAPAPASSAIPPTSPAAPNGSLPAAGPRPDDAGGGPGTDSGRHGRGGGAGGGVAALPADFPRDVPLPPGTL